VRQEAEHWRAKRSSAVHGLLTNNRLAERHSGGAHGAGRTTGRGVCIRVGGGCGWRLEPVGESFQVSARAEVAAMPTQHRDAGVGVGVEALEGRNERVGRWAADRIGRR